MTKEEITNSATKITKGLILGVDRTGASVAADPQGSLHFVPIKHFQPFLEEHELTIDHLVWRSVLMIKYVCKDCGKPCSAILIEPGVLEKPKLERY